MDRYVQYMYSYPHKTAYRPLENVNLGDYFFNLQGEGHSLYLHLPFCESKCGYCNLFSVTGCSRIQMDDYIDAVLRQMAQYREMLPPGASFGDFTIGGGTPLLLESGQIAGIFEAVRTGMPMGGGHKTVVETAPNQTRREKAGLLRELGVTRVSMGIQSFDDEELRWLGRSHDSGRARAAAELLASMGFECVNFDFIYGLPGQTGESLIRSLRTALSFSPDEIFLYPLYIKHGVRLEREGRQGMLDSDHTYMLYRHGSEYLRENGYTQMSMRRFVKTDPVGNRFLEENGSCDFKRENPGHIMPEFGECGFKGALSLGCGGRSYLGRLHTCTPYRTTRAAALEEIRRYQEREDFSSAEHGILLSEDEIRRRYVIKHLLILPGISEQAYRKAFRANVLEDFPRIRDWMDCGWLEERHAGTGRTGITNGSPGAADGDGCDYIGLTREGLGLSDYIGPQLISEEVGKRMLEWEQGNA